MLLESLWLVVLLLHLCEPWCLSPLSILAIPANKIQELVVNILFGLWHILGYIAADLGKVLVQDFLDQVLPILVLWPHALAINEVDPELLKLVILVLLQGLERIVVETSNFAKRPQKFSWCQTIPIHHALVCDRTGEDTRVRQVMLGKKYPCLLLIVILGVTIAANIRHIPKTRCNHLDR